MSSTKTVQRRLSLLAGSSLIAATLSAATFTLAPTAAFAANECAPVGVAPSDNGPAADVYACSGATTYQTTGVTYSSQGALTVNTTGVMDVGAVGVNLTGNGTDSVRLTSTGALTGSSGPVIDITSVSGPISVANVGVNATAAGATYAVRMESTGGGDITFAKTGTAGTTGINNNVAGGQAAISAVTNGGDISISAPTGLAASSVQGRLYGIVAETEGTGSVIINVTGNGGVRVGVTDAVAAIDATAGSGGITMTLGGVNGGSGSGILADTTGAISITTSAAAAGMDGIVANAGGALSLNTSVTAGSGSGIIANATGAITITGGATGAIDGIVANTDGAFTLTASGQVVGREGDALRVTTGAGVIINNVNGRIGQRDAFGELDDGGAVDFSGVTGGGVTFTNSGAGSTGGVWYMSGDSAFSAQNDLLVMSGSGLNGAKTGASVDFGAGVDTFNMGATLGVSDLALANLEAFNNSGAIIIGGASDTTLEDDVLSIPGATFTGTGASRLVVDVVLGGVSQVGCETLTGAAGCLDLRNGTTAGSTLITINDVSPGSMLSGYITDGITIVDVAGSGSSAAGHFTLDPASTGGYVHPVYGPTFGREGQAFVYMLRYDAENQRHVLISQPKSRDLFDYAVLPGAAQSVWHLTAGTVTNRQTDLRDGSEVTGLWLRTAGEVTRRDAETTFVGYDTTQTFDNAYNLHAGTVIGGMDLISGAGGGFDYVLGAQAGYVSASFEMDASDSSGSFTGATGGVYASLWSDSVFLDGAVNLNGLALDFQHPALGSKTTTYVNSVGARAEAGIRAQLTERSFAEPLATVSWVRTSFEEISLREGEVQPADSESLRAALGARLGATLAGENVSATWFVTGRAWYEFEGDSQGLVHNPGVDLPFADEFTGGFGEAEAGISVFNATNTLSGFLTTGVKAKEGYSAVNLSLGVRMAW